MKQFTRRNSNKTHIPSSNTADQSIHQTQQVSGTAQKVPASADPYSFDIEDNCGQGNTTNKAPCNNTTAPSSSACAASAAAPDVRPKRRPASPAKQPKLAPVQQTAAAAAEKQKQQQPGPAAKQQQPGPAVKAAVRQASSSTASAGCTQPAPLGAAVKAATATTSSGRGAHGVGSSGQRSGASGGAKPRPAPSIPSSNPSLAAASSGGNTTRWPSSTGTKRSRGPSDAAGSSQQHQQQQQAHRNSSSPPSPVRTSSSTEPDSTGIQQGAISLPTPHRRPRLSAGLLGAAGVVGTEARPAQTVMEAQERGELVQMQDDASYAMDGLAPTCSIDTQRDSAATLTDMLSTRKGRVALRADGLAQQFLTNLAKLKAAKDCVLDLAATLSLWLLASEDANPCYLASVAAAVLLDQLLQYDYTFEEVAAKNAAGAKLCRLLRTRPLVNLLASTGVNSTRGLLLLTLEQATSSQYASKAAAVEKLKHNLRLHGALQRLAGLIGDTAAAPGGPLAVAQQLHLLLLVLENATFTCPENGAALVQLQVTPGSKGSSSRGSAGKQHKQQQQSQGSGANGDGASSPQPQPFPAVLVGVAQQLLQGVAQEQPRTTLHVVLSVLMNLIHGNREGGALICSVGGMAVAADIYTSLLQDAAASHEALCAAVLQHLDLLSVALGVLINLVSNEPEHSRQLAAAGPAVAGSTSGSSTAVVSSFVALLCTVVSALGALLQRCMDQEDASERQQATGVPAAAGEPLSPTAAAAAAAAAASDDDEVPDDGMAAGVKVVTNPRAAADALGSNTASEASIVEVYSGMLLGFLVRDGDPALAQAVAAQLPGSSLEPLTSATGRCLDFYVRTGAITEHTRVTLEQLLQHLVATKASMAPAGVQGSAPLQAADNGPDVMEVE